MAIECAHSAMAPSFPPPRALARRQPAVPSCSVHNYISLAKPYSTLLVNGSRWRFRILVALRRRVRKRCAEERIAKALVWRRRRRRCKKSTKVCAELASVSLFSSSSEHHLQNKSIRIVVLVARCRANLGYVELLGMDFMMRCRGMDMRHSSLPDAIFFAGAKLQQRIFGDEIREMLSVLLLNSCPLFGLAAISPSSHQRFSVFTSTKSDKNVLKINIFICIVDLINLTVD